MSAFLGPIHTWLYNKVLFQNQMVETITALAEKNQWLDDSINLNRYGALEQGELADIIDEGNIHGWLQARVSLVENKLAYLVTALTDGHGERMEAIKEAMYTLGKERALTSAASAKEVFDYLETLLLNGMPCDHVNYVTENTAEYIRWEQAAEIHKQYWDAVGGEIEQFYGIRSALMKGITENSGYTLTETASRSYEIRKN